METVLVALRAMRPPFAPYEADLHRMVARQLSENGLAFEHEARLAPGCRIDFLVGDVGIEIKKGRPRAATLAAQLKRYAASERVTSLIVLSAGSVPLPPQIAGKSVRLLSLSQLWGVSLP